MSDVYSLPSYLIESIKKEDWARVDVRTRLEDLDVPLTVLGQPSRESRYCMVLTPADAQLRTRVVSQSGELLHESGYFLQGKQGDHVTIDTRLHAGSAPRCQISLHGSAQGFLTFPFSNLAELFEIRGNTLEVLADQEIAGVKTQVQFIANQFDSPAGYLLSK